MNSKIVATVIVILVGSIASSIILLNWLSGNTVSTAQEESLQVTESGVWYSNYFPYCQAAVLIVNNKDIAATIQRVTVRGIESDWKDVYYWEGEIGSVSNLSPASNDLTGTSVEIVVDGKERTFQQATGNVVLDGYKAIVLYVRNAGNISSQDIPKGKVTIAIFTQKNVYLEEAPFHYTIGFMGTEQLSITYADFDTTTRTRVTLNVTNSGSNSVVITNCVVNDVAVTITGAPISVPGNTKTLEMELDITALDAAGWVDGNTYNFKLTSQKGNTFPYTAVAPAP